MAQVAQTQFRPLQVTREPTEGTFSRSGLRSCRSWSHVVTLVSRGGAVARSRRAHGGAGRVATLASPQALGSFPPRGHRLAPGALGLRPGHSFGLPDPGWSPAPQGFIDTGSGWSQGFSGKVPMATTSCPQDTGAGGFLVQPSSVWPVRAEDGVLGQ